jgi:RNAse (barnase) inhibitor barstar
LQGVHEQAPPKKVHPFVVELAKLDQDIKQNIGKLPAENVEKLEDFLTNSPKSPINIIYKRLEASKEKNSVYLNEALNGLVEEISASIQNRKLELGMYSPNDEEEEQQEDSNDEYGEDDCDETLDEEQFNPGAELLESFAADVANASGSVNYFIIKNGRVLNVVLDSPKKLSVELSSFDNLDDIVVLKKVNISYGVIVDG